MAVFEYIWIFYNSVNMLRYFEVKTVKGEKVRTDFSG